VNNFLLNTQVDNVNVSNFFIRLMIWIAVFVKKLKGFLSAQAHITGSINNEGNVVPRSINARNIDCKRRVDQL